jgi:predicted O-methyltransferase YrrM
MSGPEPEVIATKPWLSVNAQAGSYALGMLGLEERKLLYQLARDVYTGEGAVVELGAFCGASTCCLAAGLRDNLRARAQRVHSYDCFIASEPYLAEFICTHFGEKLKLGESFELIFRRATAEFGDRIEIHAGDLLEQTWPFRLPIELLFIDVAKTLALSGKVLTEFFSHLIPGKSIVIHQDFYHPTVFYLPIVMDYLRDHFTIIEPGRDSSVAFRLESAIPWDKLQTASRYTFSFAQEHGAFRRMRRRVGMPGRDYLRISECAAIGTRFGERRFRSAFAAALRRARLEPDQVWTDGLAWCGDFKASHIRTRLYGAPTSMPSATLTDKIYVTMLNFCSALAAFSKTA